MKQLQILYGQLTCFAEAACRAAGAWAHIRSSGPLPWRREKSGIFQTVLWGWNETMHGKQSQGTRQALTHVLLMPKPFIIIANIHHVKESLCLQHLLPTPALPAFCTELALLFWEDHTCLSRIPEREDNERQKRAEHLGSQLLSPSLSSGSAQHIPRTATPTAWKPGEFHPPCHQVKATRSPFLP